MGKNVNTEIKCHSLLPLDDIVVMVSHSDCIPEVSLSIIISGDIVFGKLQVIVLTFIYR